MAFASVPFVDAVIAYLCFPLVWAMGGHSGRLLDPEGVALSFAIISGVLGLLVTAAGAVPLIIWLSKSRRISLPASLTAGVLLGNAPFAAYLLLLILPATLSHLSAGTMAAHLSPLPDLVAGTLRMLLIGSAMGALSGAAFWFLGIYAPGATGRGGSI